MMTTRQRAKFETTQLYLKRIAGHLVRTHYPGQEVDELVQVMNLYILERAQKDATFLDQARGFISRSAGWHARNWCSPERKGANHGNDRMAFSLDHTDVDGRDMREVLGDDEPDHDLVIAVRQVLAGLDGLTAQIATMMLTGFRVNEIAETLGVTRQTISAHKRRLRSALAPLAGAA